MSKKAPSPLIITRSEPIPISQKLPYTPIFSKSAPTSYSDLFIGSPRSGLSYEQSKKCSLLLGLHNNNPLDDSKDQPLIGEELVIEREDS